MLFGRFNQVIPALTGGLFPPDFCMQGLTSTELLPEASCNLDQDPALHWHGDSQPLPVT